MWSHRHFYSDGLGRDRAWDEPSRLTGDLQPSPAPHSLCAFGQTHPSLGSDFSAGTGGAGLKWKALSALLLCDPEGLTAGYRAYFTQVETFEGKWQGHFCSCRAGESPIDLVPWGETVGCWEYESRPSPSAQPSHFLTCLRELAGLCWPSFQKRLWGHQSLCSFAV